MTITVSVPLITLLQNIRSRNINWFFILVVNQTEEWFYQVKGDMLLRIVENNTTFRDISIKEGEMFLLPGSCG